MRVPLGLAGRDLQHGRAPVAVAENDRGDQDMVEDENCEWRRVHGIDVGLMACLQQGFEE